MNRQEIIQDKTRNNIFAAAFDYLKRNTDIKNQKILAERMGVNKDTITNILRYYTPVTEDIITKLQTVSKCIFNLQWLRGQSDVMLAKDVFADPLSDNNAQLLTAKDENIAALKRELAAKDAAIAAKDDLIALLRQQIADLRNL